MKSTLGQEAVDSLKRFEAAEVSSAPSTATAVPGSMPMMRHTEERTLRKTGNKLWRETARPLLSPAIQSHSRKVSKLSG